MNNIEFQNNIVEEILNHLDLYNYICVDDFLKSKKFNGDISYVKMLLKKYFRKENQYIVKGKLERLNELLVQSRGEKDLLLGRFSNENFEVMNRDLNIVKEELESTLEKIKVLKSRYRVLILEKNIAEQSIDKYSEEFDCLNSEKDLNSNNARDLKNKLNSANKKILLLKKQINLTKGELSNLEIQLTRLNNKQLKLETRKKNLNNNKISVDIREYTKKQQEFFNRKRNILFYLNYWYMNVDKMYIYNYLEYSIELINEPNELQNKLSKYKNTTLKLQDNYLETLNKIITDSSRIISFKRELPDLNEYNEYSKKFKNSAVNRIYEFIESYFENKTRNCKEETDKFTMFYRGQSNSNYQLMPSIFRNEKLLKNEDYLYHEINVKCPSEILNGSSHLEILTTMQHYSLPTRLVDVTHSPLIATFFAIEDKNNIDMDCELIISKVSNEDVKYYDSDTVEVISAISPLKYKEKQELIKETLLSLVNLLEAMFELEVLDDKISDYRFVINQRLPRIIEEYNKKTIVKKLHNEIQKEWKSDLVEINPLDILRVCYVKPKQNNNRIIRQQGAFIVCGLLGESQTINAINRKRITTTSKFDDLISNIKNVDEEIKKVYEDIDIKSKTPFMKIIIPSAYKPKFKDWLSNIGVDETSIYPEFEKVARYLKDNL